MADSERVPFQRYDQLATFILANIAWVILALPIITLPLGMVGMFQVMSIWTRRKQPEFFRDFFGAMRQYWWKSLLIGLLDVAIAGLILANFIILNMMGFSNPLVLIIASVTGFVAIVLILANMYIWSLLVVAEFGLQRILMLSIKLVFAHPLQSFVTLIAGLAPLIFTLLLRLPIFLWLIGLVSLSALIMNKGTWRIIRRYIPAEELLIYENLDD